MDETQRKIRQLEDELRCLYKEKAESDKRFNVAISSRQRELLRLEQSYVGETASYLCPDGHLREHLQLGRVVDAVLCLAPLEDKEKCRKLATRV